MKPLSERQRAFAYRWLVDGPLRVPARVAYHRLLSSQIARFTRAPARRRPWPGSVTVLIRTFERPAACARLIASIQRHYDAPRIVVADDSRVVVDRANVTTVRLPFDVGVAAGRNAGLAAVDTPYVVMFDDDFLCDSQTDIPGALAILQDHGSIDLLGGAVIDLPIMIRHDFSEATLFPTKAAPRVAPGTRIGPATVMDMVANFFIARVDAVRAVGWDPRLTMMEHTDFFTRARGHLVSAMWDGWRILHVRDPFDRDYLALRNRLDGPAQHLARKYARTPALGNDR